MTPTQSSLDRQAGKYQVDDQRKAILDAAETLFLRAGLENTRMVDIARQAKITRATLYRYFANRDEIAVLIQIRMMEKIRSVLPDEALQPTLASQRLRAQLIIRNFPQLRDAFRYIGMFDKIYLDIDPGSPLARWTKEQLALGGFGGRASAGRPSPPALPQELGVILSVITWFLEKLALRGELTWSDPAVPLEEHLAFFESMIMRSFDELENKPETK